MSVRQLLRHSIRENDYEIERTQLNDAANALLNLSELKNPR